MSFFDVIYVIAGLAVMIVLVMAYSFVFDAFMPRIQDDLPVGANETLINAMDKTETFADNSFIAMFFIFSAVIIGATVFLVSHPLGLAIWLCMNIITILVWDALDDLITGLEASSLNTGVMSNAIAFFHGDLPKAAVIINVLLGAVLFGRRAMG